MRRRISSGAALALLLAAAGLPGPAGAEERMAFYVRNGVDRAVVLEFRSRDRDMVWPGNGQVFYLDPRQNKSVPIECNAGERICYGAWVYGAAATAWGVGPRDDRECPDCCRICTGGTDEIIDLAP